MQNAIEELARAYDDTHDLSGPSRWSSRWSEDRLGSLLVQ